MDKLTKSSHVKQRKKKGELLPKICQEQCKLTDDICVLKPYLLVLTLAASKFARVTVIWASPRFGHPHSQTLVIWAYPVTLTLTRTKVAKVIWEGDAHITSQGLWEWGCLAWEKALREIAWVKHVLGRFWTMNCFEWITVCVMDSHWNRLSFDLSNYVDLWVDQ